LFAHDFSWFDARNSVAAGLTVRANFVRPRISGALALENIPPMVGARI
jgi:hypothetical protein